MIAGLGPSLGLSQNRPALGDQGRRRPWNDKRKGMPLRHFFFRQFSGEFLLLAFAENSQGNTRAFLETLQQLAQLIWFHQDLVVQHLQDVGLLHSGGGGRAVRNDIIDNQSDTGGLCAFATVLCRINCQT